MPDQEIRVGLIGAGRNTRERHIPGFNKVNGLEIAAVANRSRESGRVVADQFNIPTVYDNWQELLEDESINAICIGTWPYMHRTLTVAALEAGKHVLCEAPIRLGLEVSTELKSSMSEFRYEIFQVKRQFSSGAYINSPSNPKMAASTFSLSEVCCTILDTCMSE